MRHGVNLLLPAVVLALAACGKSDAPRKSGDSESTVQAPAHTGGMATTIHLVVQGGPHAGTYDAKSSDITCTYGFAGPGAWGNQYSVRGKKSNEFSSLQLIVPDAKDGADGTGEFMMTIGFGELLKEGYSEHNIDTHNGAKNKGSGTVQVDDRKTGGKVTFKGKAEDGAMLEGTIDCHQMMRNGE
jgi:hypothetical protein